MRLLVCGSRDWTDGYPIRAVLGSYVGETLIHGAARGADSIADAIGDLFQMEIEKFPADWKGHGRAAGPIRNKLMLTEGKPDVVWAFKDGFDHSMATGGTENMVRIAKEAGIPTYIVSHG
jgi:hypothetical protein